MREIKELEGEWKGNDGKECEFSERGERVWGEWWKGVGVKIVNMSWGGEGVVMMKNLEICEIDEDGIREGWKGIVKHGCWWDKWMIMIRRNERETREWVLRDERRGIEGVVWESCCRDMENEMNGMESVKKMEYWSWLRFLRWSKMFGGSDLRLFSWRAREKLRVWKWR